MKFGFMKYRLMNEASEMDSDGGGDTDGGFTSSSEAYEQSSKQSITTDDSNAFKNLGLDAAKYGFDKEEVGNIEEEEQGSSTDEEAGQATDESAILKRINSLGAIHNNAPVEVKSIDELKSLVQMGKDYTLKTQSLSEERKALESERANTEKELSEAIKQFNDQQAGLEKELQEMQQFRFALEHLSKNAPDVFAEVQSVYEDIGSRFKNPILDQQMQAMNKRFSELEGQLKERESKLVIDEFEREKGSLSSTEQSLKELGVNVDWTQVKNEWAKTGLPLKSVLGSLYFDSVAKAQASKSKVEATKAKTSVKPTGGAGSPRTGSKIKGIDPKLKGMDYAMALLNRHTN